MSVAAVVLIVVAYQLFVSRLVSRCKVFTHAQRRNQPLLIWLVQVLGALICHAVVQSHSTLASTDDSLVSHYGNADDYGSPRGSRLYRNPSSHTESYGDVDEDS
jgi:hypothetical protein